MSPESREERSVDKERNATTPAESEYHVQSALVEHHRNRIHVWVGAEHNGHRRYRATFGFQTDTPEGERDRVAWFKHIDYPDGTTPEEREVARAVAIGEASEVADFAYISEPEWVSSESDA